MLITLSKSFLEIDYWKKYSYFELISKFLGRPSEYYSRVVRTICSSREKDIGRFSVFLSARLANSFRAVNSAVSRRTKERSGCRIAQNQIIISSFLYISSMFVIILRLEIAVQFSSILHQI
jgi:hypothetical protein